MAEDIMVALKRAAENKEFAVQLFKNPIQFKTQYNLQDRDIRAIQASVPASVIKSLDVDYE